MNYPDVMTKGEAAGYSRFSERTIDRWVVRGWLKCHRLRNGQLRFQKNEIDQAMHKQWDDDAGKSAVLDSDLG